MNHRAIRQPWRYYDAVATSHEQVWAPVFTLPATDLVAMLGLPSPGRVLDVGSGTGVALLPAVKAVGPGGLVVGLDPSVEMLRIAQSKKLTPLVVAEVPGVPFANGTFDVVLANFVVSHFTHYDVALVDMVRVLRRGGQLGVTAWGPSQSVYSEVWREVAGSFVSKDLLLDASRQGVPWAWEEWFSEPIHVREALQDAGLIKVKVRRREYRTVMSVAAYLIARETSLQGRFMRQTLTKAQWKHFQESAAEEFRSRFGDSIRYTGEVHLAVSTRP